MDQELQTCAQQASRQPADAAMSGGQISLPPSRKNIVPIQFETTEPWAFSGVSAQQEEEQDESSDTGPWDQSLAQKLPTVTEIYYYYYYYLWFF